MVKHQTILLLRQLKRNITNLIQNEEYYPSCIEKANGFSKIDIFAFIEDKNIGDPVIGETAKFLVETICEKNDLKAIVNLHRMFPSENYKKFWITNVLRHSCAKVCTNYERFLLYLGFRLYILLNPKYKKYYSQVLCNSDMTIFGGGGMLKYLSQEFWAADYCILEYCDKHSIPVYFNAVGLEGYDDKNFTSRLLKKLLGKKCVSKVTTRDDIVALNKFLPNKNNLVVGDSALFSKELYGSETKTDIIGINTIRSGIFNTNGFSTTEEELINFYSEMIKRLEVDGYRWQIFTNGLNSDYKLGIKVLLNLGLKPNDENIMTLPETGEELAKNISRYQGIIAGRMHAHIIATSYGIPTVGQIWNEKIKWFSKHLGAEDRFFYPEEMHNYDLVYSRFKQALLAGNSSLNTNKLKEATYRELELAIKNTLKQNGKGLKARYVKKLDKDWAIYKELEQNLQNVQVNLEIDSYNPYPQKVWTMWLQGLEQAPPIVKACVESLKKHSSREVILLTNENLSQYVELPKCIEDKYSKGLISNAHYSDIVRLYLLEKYGGTWIDPTVYCTRNFDELISYELMITQTYSRNNPKIITNYFLHSENPHNYLIQSLLSTLYEYWRKYDYAIDYAIFHHIHRVLIENNKMCRTIWDSVPRIMNSNFKLLRPESFKEYNQTYIDYLLKQSPLHKFSYKKEFIAENIAENSFYNKIIEPYI